MALAVEADEIIVKSRDEWLALYLRSHQLRSPASVAIDSEPYVSGTAIADQLNIQSENARQMSRQIPLASISGKSLDALLKALGLGARFPETGSQGALVADTSLNGSTIVAGTECSYDNGNVFYCTITQLYVTGQNVPIAAKSTGPNTNLAAGTQLVWGAAPPGSAPKLRVFKQTDGSGLTGGRLAETDDEVRNRISDYYANPPAAGNDAAYQAAIEFSQGHGIAVQKAFTMPCALGPGTTAFCFTMSPATPGASRRPNATQLQRVYDFVKGKFPGDDGIFACVLQAVLLEVIVRVNWSVGTNGWVDVVPWPPYQAASDTPGPFVVSAVTSPTAFSVDCLSGNRAGAIAPQVGNNFALFDRDTGHFRQKRILTVTGAGPWALVIDSTNGVSDTGYVPVLGQRLCPWSDSLDTLVSPVVDYFGEMGPGEQFSYFFDPGTRQKRNPPSPRYWPSTVSNRLAADILKLDSIADAVIVKGLGQSTPAGTPAALSKLLELDTLSIFPL